MPLSVHNHHFTYSSSVAGITFADFTMVHPLPSTPFANQHERGGEPVEHHIIRVFLEMPEAEETEGRN
jgi:hypothetical protein